MNPILSLSSPSPQLPVSFFIEEEGETVPQHILVSGLLSSSIGYLLTGFLLLPRSCIFSPLLPSSLCILPASEDDSAVMPIPSSSRPYFSLLKQIPFVFTFNDRVMVSTPDRGNTIAHHWIPEEVEQPYPSTCVSLPVCIHTHRTSHLDVGYLKGTIINRYSF